jgi:hypothetical protein
MPKVQAWERLNNPEYSGKLTMGEFYDLLLKAGYSEEVAQRAASKRGWDRLEAGVQM